MEIIGHRGAKGLAPENTIKGIKHALLRGVDWIEFDVRVTKDGYLVVLHDRTLLRITKDHRRTKDIKLVELRGIATRSGEKIPTFAEVMQAIGQRAKINIELKSRGAAKEVVTEIKQQVHAGRPYSDFMVSSFRPWLLKEIQKKDPAIPLLLLQGMWPFLFMLLPQLRLTGVGFWRFAAPRLAITLAKKRNLWTIVSTVNSQREARLFAEKGINAIVTDVPQAFKPFWPQVLRLILITAALILLLSLIGYIL